MRDVSLWRKPLCCVVVPLILAAGCERTADTTPAEKLVVYCSVDEVFARNVFDVYQARTGVHLSIVFDSEAGKTTGLVNKIVREAEAGRSRADVFWSSELFNTILLARRNLLAPYESAAATDIPPRFLDSQHRWTALAARARVLAFNPQGADFSPRGASRRLKPAARLRRLIDETRSSKHYNPAISGRQIKRLFRGPFTGRFRSRPGSVLQHRSR